jgi:hypothetical protein
VNLGNTIVAGNTGSSECGVGGGGSIVSQGNNLAGDDSCNLTAGGDLPGADANLGPLADNGGPTLTHALLAGSDAIDAGNDEVCAAEPVGGIDQRGVSRPQDGDGDGTAVCDIGAYEAEPAGLSVTKFCVGEGFDATFAVAVGDISQPIACGASVAFPDLPAGDHTLSETIAGDDADDFDTLIVCEPGTSVDGTEATVTIPADGAGVACVVINFFDDAGIDIVNTNTNTIEIDNDNTNNNANDNDNANFNDNLNENENDNQNENTQDQTNEQGQDNANDQTNNIDSSPEVNIDFGE